MSGRASSPWLLRGAIAALAIALAVVVAISIDGEDERGPTEGPAAEAGSLEPRVVSADELAELAAGLDHPVYWAGEIEGRALRVEISEEGNVLVAYPPEDEPEDFPLAGALAIGTYPIPDPSGALDRLAAEPGADVHTSESGRLGVMRGPSAYFADPEGGVQVEVYAPRPREARRMALSDEVRPVE